MIDIRKAICELFKTKRQLDNEVIAKNLNRKIIYNRKTRRALKKQRKFL